MNIREFRTTDANAVIKLWTTCGLVVPWNDPHKDIARKLQVDPDLFLVGERDGEIIATVMGGYEGHRGWINYLAVSPECQKQGLGRQIMNHVEMRLVKRGCPKINLQVRELNHAVISFYQALGYGNDNVVSLGKRLERD